MDPGVWYHTICEGGCRFITAGVREEENTEEVEVAPGVTVGSLTRFRAALIGPIQGLARRRRLRR